MTDQQLLERIVLDPNVMAGKPVIRGTRLTVDFILNLLAHSATEADSLHEYPGLTQEDLQACFFFATKSLECTTFIPLVAGRVRCVFSRTIRRDSALRGASDSG